MPEKTEKPTGKRISESRKKGQVAVSRDLTSALVLYVGLILLGGPGRQILTGIMRMMTQNLTYLPMPVESTPSIQYLRQIGFQYFSGIIPGFAIVVGGLMLTGIVSTVSQTKFLWASDNIGLDLKKIKLNPLAFFKKMASPTGIAELFKSIAKLFIVTMISYGYLNSHLTDILGLQALGVKFAFAKWMGMAHELAVRAATAYLILGIADYIFQRWNTDKNIKMTKEEVKDEMAQTEGNPQIKGAIRRKQRQFAIQRMMTQVPEAAVVITNPIHLAIAIQYEPDEMNAPKVIAKGARLIAERIIHIAEEHEIPVVQNIPLARALYNVELEQEIPPELYTAMAEILVYIYKLRGTLSTATY